MIAKISVIITSLALASQLYAYAGASVTNEPSLREQLIELQKAKKLKILTGYSSGIYLFDIEAKEEQSVVEAKGEFTLHNIALFPEGNQIAYILFKNSLTPIVKGILKVGIAKEGPLSVDAPNPIERTKSLQILDLESKTTKQLDVDFTAITSFAISPDGKKIAFVADAEQRKLQNSISDSVNADLISRQDPNNQSLYVYDLDSGSTTKLIHGDIRWIKSNTPWSPDGKKLIYENTDNKIIIYNFDTHFSTELISGGAFDLSWMPDSDRVVYRPSGADKNYYSINVDGSEKELFLDNTKTEVGIFFIRHIGRIESAIHFSPNGKYILFGRSRGEGLFHQMYVMDFETKEVANLGECSRVIGWHWSN